MKSKWLIPLIAAALLQSCNYVDVSSEYDTSANFGSFRTFNIQQLRVGDRRKVNEFDEQRILNAITSEMEARGYARVSSSADLSVEPEIVTEDKQYTAREVEPYATGYTTYKYTTYEYTEGTLVVDIKDTRKQKLIWQGVGIGTVEKSATNKVQRVNDAVAKIFRDFPIRKY